MQVLVDYENVWCIFRYGLELIQVSGSIQDALSQLKSSHPQLKAVCMGTRHTDPHSSNLEPFSPTDGDWPDYMRVNCILVSCLSSRRKWVPSLGTVFTTQVYSNVVGCAKRDCWNRTKLSFQVVQSRGCLLSSRYSLVLCHVLGWFASRGLWDGCM